MCGIAGILHPATSTEELSAQTRRVLESMRYRGPDALGVFAENRLAMGNVRLAIQGIDPTGNQPIYNEDGSVVVVFNGEIYNFPELRKSLEATGHRFATATDTELLVHLYEEKGERLADELNGMFAFALYDRKRHELVLGRDKTAQKPLFMHQGERGVCFASELLALTPWLPARRLRPSATRDFLSLGYYLEPEGLLEGVESLPPGTVVRLAESGAELSRHQIPLPELGEFSLPGNFDAWLEEADAVLARAVRRSTLSDVPVTVFLSGGVDSTLTACYLREVGTVRVVHTGSFADEKDFDEFSHSRALADELGLEVERVDLSKRVLAEAIEDFCADSSQPQGDYSGLPSYVLARETARRFKVVLGGDGGDELFSGYPTYTLPALQRRFGFIPRQAIEAGAWLCRQAGPPKGYLPLRFRLQLVGQAWGLSTPSAHYAVKDFLPPSLVDEVVARDTAAVWREPPPGMVEFARRFGPTDGRDEMRRLGRLDFSTFLGSCTIPKMERNCMRWSLENRLPLLDDEVLALAARTPAEWQRRGRVGKWCLRRLLEKKLGHPPSLNPRKQGFGPPLAHMLREELKPWAEELLHRPHPLFPQDLAARIERLSAAGWDLHRLVWNICILKDWTLRHRVDCG